MTMGQSVPMLRGGERGQSLVEFSLLIPLFLVLVTGLFEFVFAFNALLNSNFASRTAGLVAAEAGNTAGGDCLILGGLDGAVGPPAEVNAISQVEIQRTNSYGTVVYATNVYQRTGSTRCTLSDGTTRTVPYSAVSSGYPSSQRCNVLPPYGCPTLTPTRTTVDNVAVQITYVYPWHTPLKSLLGFVGGSMSGTGWTFVQRNVFRMEPVL
jgi:Flp pilus assembly protein TadG